MMPVRLYVHPDNVEAMRKGLRRLKARVAENMHIEFNPEYIPIEIVPCDFVPKGEPTGLYILSNGAKVKRDDIRIVEGFVTYGPEDLRFLLYSGKVKVDIQIAAYVIDGPSPMDVLKYSLDLSMSISKRFASFMEKGLAPWPR
jgi:hypothetical protein